MRDAIVGETSVVGTHTGLEIGVASFRRAHPRNAGAMMARDPLFMSPEHVAAMNALLVDNDEVRAACAALEKPLTLGYELFDGPDGETVYWSMAFTDTVRFGLDKVDSDLLFRGDWARMVRASRSARQGEQIDPDVEAIGDLAVMETISSAFTVAQSNATLPVEVPDV